MARIEKEKDCFTEELFELLNNKNKVMRVDAILSKINDNKDYYSITHTCFIEKILNDLSNDDRFFFIEPRPHHPLHIGLTAWLLKPIECVEERKDQYSHDILECMKRIKKIETYLQFDEKGIKTHG